MGVIMESCTQHFSILWVINTAICFPSPFFLLLLSSADKTSILLKTEAGKMEETVDKKGGGRRQRGIRQRDLQLSRAACL